LFFIFLKIGNGKKDSDCPLPGEKEAARKEREGKSKTEVPVPYFLFPKEQSRLLHLQKRHL
jgi:hypothetical protein